MDQRLSIVTLGVTDLKRAREFYEHLGWRGQEFQETVFFQAGGMVVILWGRDKLAADAGVPTSEPGSFNGVALAHNVASIDEVKQVCAAAEEAGAVITRPPAETFYGGFAGYFQDPDGHLWEIAYNPGFALGDDGSITLPDFSAPPEHSDSD